MWSAINVQKRRCFTVWSAMVHGIPKSSRKREEINMEEYMDTRKQSKGGISLVRGPSRTKALQPVRVFWPAVTSTATPDEPPAPRVESGAAVNKGCHSNPVTERPAASGSQGTHGDTGHDSQEGHDAPFTLADQDDHGGEQPQGFDAADWTERETADGWILERADAAGLEVIDMPPPCPTCNGSDFWQDAADGWHCSTCRPAPPTGERLRRRVAALRGRQPGKHAVTWPIEGADAVLQLTPDDLPPAPWHFEGLDCYDSGRLLNELRIDITVIGCGGPHYRSGRLPRDIERLLRLARRHGSERR